MTNETKQFDNANFNKRIAYAELFPCVHYEHELIEAAKKASEHIDALTDALEWLVDCQNGPPLPGRHEKHWREAMDKANRLLGRDG